jgi:hypothetical protein
MSQYTIDCRVIEQRIAEQYLDIGTTLDQLHLLNPNDPNVQEKRNALTQKLHALHEQLDNQYRALEAYRQGKGVDFPDLERVSSAHGM